jgi:hypothetical protein
MKILRITLRVLALTLRRCFACVLLTYWVSFIFYTTNYMITGGPNRVVVWYRHIDRAVFTWNWGEFLTRQIIIFLVTVAVFWFEFRSFNLSRERTTTDTVR